jgi:hypothetical protein
VPVELGLTSALQKQREFRWIDETPRRTFPPLLASNRHFHAAGAWNLGGGGMKKYRKRVILALEPGLYLVSADRNNTRVWQTDGTLVVGHGSKLRRSVLKKIFGKLQRTANAADAAVDRKKRRHSA